MSNRYDTFDDTEFRYYYPFTFNGRLSYLSSKDKARCSWKYGDEVLFQISLKVDSEDEPLYNECSIYVDFYNWRYEPILQKVFTPDSSAINTEEEILELTLTSEESAQYFPKGLYFCSVRAINDTTQRQHTLFTAGQIMCKVS